MEYFILESPWSLFEICLSGLHDLSAVINSFKMSSAVTGTVAVDYYEVFRNLVQERF